MKKIITLFVPVVLLIISCNNDPCDNITCLNGGVCIDGSCNCPPGFSGANCQNQDPCFNVTCLNGGSCVNGLCNCLPGFTGPDCSQQVTPTQVRVTGVTVNQFPPLDNGADWDGTFCGVAYPDIYITIEDGSSTFFTSGFISDCIPGNSYSFTTGLPAISSNPTGNWVVRLYDNDSGACSPDDYMGGLQKVIYNSTNGFPSTIRFFNQSAQIDIVLTVEYIF